MSDIPTHFSLATSFNLAHIFPRVVALQLKCSKFILPPVQVQECTKLEGGLLRPQSNHQTVKYHKYRTRTSQVHVKCSSSPLSVGTPKSVLQSTFSTHIPI